jgi:hypothetical protein
MPDDPKDLRALAEQIQREEATLRARADALGRRALELEEQAQAIEHAQAVVPIRKLWGGLVIVDGAVSVEEARRSADPDAVARDAVDQERTQRTEPAKQSREMRGAEAKARVGEMCPVVKAEKQGNGRRTTDGEIAAEVAARLTDAGFKISARTVRRYIPKDL